MKKGLSYIGFTASAILIVLAFVTAKTYTQLVIAIIFYPLLAYFALKLFPRSTHPDIPALSVQPIAPMSSNPLPAQNGNQVEIVDIDKRTFLKLLGTAGISFFLFSLLGRRAEDYLFSRTFQSGMGLTGNEPDITPNTSDVITAEGYRISEIDDDIISYYGFTNNTGGWLIMREDSENNSFRYAKGANDFSKNWEQRQRLKYDYYYNLF